MTPTEQLTRQIMTAAFEALFLTPGAVLAWWTDYLRFLASSQEQDMTFVIATGDQLEEGLRISRFEDASDVPEPGVDVVVSLPETGTHALGRVIDVDRSEQVIYLDVDDDSRVWS
jgi:hypothetical protein